MLSFIHSSSTVHSYRCVIVPLIIGKRQAPRKMLRITYIDKQTLLRELLQKDSSVSVHEKNLHILPTENV